MQVVVYIVVVVYEVVVQQRLQNTYITTLLQELGANIWLASTPVTQTYSESIVVEMQNPMST